MRAAVEVALAVEAGRALERAFQRVGPAVVRAAQVLRAARGFGHHRRGVVAAHIEEAAQHAIVAAHHQDGFAGDLAGDVLAGFAQLVHATGQLPGAREGGPAFECGDAFIDVPRGRNGAGFGQRRRRIVLSEELGYRGLHTCMPSDSAAMLSPL